MIPVMYTLLRRRRTTNERMKRAKLPSRSPLQVYGTVRETLFLRFCPWNTMSDSRDPFFFVTVNREFCWDNPYHIVSIWASCFFYIQK